MATLEELIAERARRTQETQQVPRGTQPLQAPVGDLVAEQVRRQRESAQAISTAALSPTGVIGAEEARTSRAVKELPELGFGGLFQEESALSPDVLKAVSAASVTTNPEELANILGTIPNIGITRTPEGDLIANNNETGQQVVINKPGLSGLDVIQGLNIVGAFTPSGRVASVPAQVGGRAAVGALGAGLTQTAIEGIQQQLGGELNEEEIAIAAGLGGAAELVVPAIQAFRNSRRAKQVGADPEEFEDIAAATGQIEKARESTTGLQRATGVEVGLFPAQQSQVPSQLIKQRLLPQLDQSSRIAVNALENQNKQAFDATTRLLDTISPQTSVSGAPQRLRTAAERAIEAQKLVRQEAAAFGDIIKQADSVSAGKNVNIENVNNIVDGIERGSASGSGVERLAARVKKLLTPKEGKEFLDYSNLQSAKKELDDIINSSPETGVGKSVKAKALEIKNSLVDEMKNGFDAFKEASETFARESGPVDELQSSIVGRLSKVTDVQLKNISSEIFNPRTTVDDVLKARNIINKTDPGAWDDIVRNELEFRIGSLTTSLKDGGIDTVENLPSIINRGLFGNAKQRNVLLRSMNSTQRKNFVFLEDALKRAASGRAAGSPTASFTEKLKNLKNRFGVWSDVVLSPIKTLKETGNEAAFKNRMEALADIMFDPQWSQRVETIRKLGNKSPASARALSQLVDDAIKANTEREEE